VIEELFNFDNIHNLNFLDMQALVLEHWVLVLRKSLVYIPVFGPKQYK